MLIGFCLFLVFGIHQALLKAGLLTPLSQRQSSAVILLVLKYGFWLGIALFVIGFGYAGFQAHRDANREQSLQAPITQQAGPCGSNIVGDNNNITTGCLDKEAKTK